jgi:hypothetical protein
MVTRQGSNGFRVIGLLLPILALAGCGTARQFFAAGQTATSPAPAPPGPRAYDPLADFAGTAAPGSQGRVVLASGASAPVRLVRAYNAASGRECRELLVGGLADARSQVYCQDAGGWVASRPLLRGGAVGQP